MAKAAKLARRILPLLDLTNLEQDCVERDLDHQCASPATFRFGASTLLDDLVAVLGAPRPVERRLGY